MIRRHSSRVINGVLSLALLVAAAAYGATTIAYRGKTSQQQRISFTMSGGYVSKLQYYIFDSCPRRHRVRDFDSGFPRMRIRKSKFGGTFADPGVGARAVVAGKVSGTRVIGSLTDTVKHPKYHTICRGHATFSLKRA